MYLLTYTYRQCILYLLHICILYIYTVIDLYYLLQFALVLTTLGLACDEVSWLFRHGNVQPPKAKHKCSVEDFIDK